MIYDVTSDHAQRLTIVAQALKLVSERLEFVEGKAMSIEPKVNTLETELLKAARDIAANDGAMKEIVEAHDKHVKTTLEANDAQIKSQIDQMRKVIEQVSSQSGAQDSSRGVRATGGTTDAEARKKIEEINAILKTIDQNVREANLKCLRTLRPSTTTRSPP